MTSLPAVLTIVTIAAITPGPNNFIVMAAAVRGGAAGAGTLFMAVPEMQTLIRIAGAAYLLWLGICFTRQVNTPEDEANTSTLPNTIIGVASFQLLNPKSWVLVLTAMAATGGSLTDLIVLILIFTSVMAVCLGLWALTGRIISRWLNNLRFKRGFDTVMGGLLIGTAVALLSRSVY